MLTGSMKSFTPLDSKTWSPTPPLSSIIRPYWNPEQPPPCTNTRSPLPTLPSSVNSSLIFEAAVVDTFTIFSILQGKKAPENYKPVPCPYKLGPYLGQFLRGFLFDVLLQAVAVCVHGDDGLEIFHGQVPHGLGGPELHQ